MTHFEAIHEMRRRIRHAEQMVSTFTKTVARPYNSAELEWAQRKLSKWENRLSYRTAALARLREGVI